MKVIFFFLMFILFSCKPSSAPSMGVAEFDLKISENWVYAEKIENLKYNGEVLTRPPGIEQLVMTVVIPDVGGVVRKRHCLYYQVPYKEKVGRIRVQEVKIVDECPDISTEDKVLFSLSGISNFKVTYLNFKLSLNFQLDKKNQEIIIPLHNVDFGLIHEKYRSVKERKLISGLKFLRLAEDSFDFASNKYLGKLSDRFSRGSAIRCHQVDKNCETIGENRCDDCRYGWYEVVDFQCPQGGSKFCGQNHCGEKNEPACPRGIKVVHPEDAGICQSDLESVINADKILVCQ